MKKFLALLSFVLLALLLTGCKDKDSVTYTVMTPNGSPALAQMYMQEDSDKYAVDVVSGADPLVAAFGSSSHDFIFAPTNLGAKLYKANQNYIFIAAVSFGNYYLITEADGSFDLASLAGKDIVVFGQNQTSDVILQYILSANNITANITYVADVATATSTFVQDPTKIVMIAEPSLSVVRKSHPDVKTIDLQNEYKTLTGSDSYPQAGVFAKASLSSEAIDQFLTDLQASVEKVNSHVEDSANLGVSLEYGFPYDVLVNAIPNSHLDYKSALDAKTSLESYFNLIIELNGALVGGSLPESGFYYNPSK